MIVKFTLDELRVIKHLVAESLAPEKVKMGDPTNKDKLTILDKLDNV
jgi:hypothetical protein